jgi:hypothetical protein
VSDWKKRVCAVSSLVDAVVAIAPVPFVADVAFPVACVGECFARVTEDSLLESLRGVVFAHEYMRRCRRFSQWRYGRSISVTRQDMRILVTWRIPTLWTAMLVSRPGSPAKAEPVLAPFTGTIATMTEIILPIVAL